MGNLVEMAQRLRPLVVEAVGQLDDRRISQEAEAVHLCRTLRGDGAIIQAGTRINWRGTVKKAAVTLADRPDLWPDANPGGWEEMAYRDGVRIIPGVIPPGLAFAEGEKGWWKGRIYESLIPANVYTPESYPRSWRQTKNR